MRWTLLLLALALVTGMAAMPATAAEETATGTTEDDVTGDLAMPMPGSCLEDPARCCVTTPMGIFCVS